MCHMWKNHESHDNIVSSWIPMVWTPNYKDQNERMKLSHQNYTGKDCKCSFWERRGIETPMWSLAGGKGLCMSQWVSQSQMAGDKKQNLIHRQTHGIPADSSQTYLETVISLFCSISLLEWDYLFCLYLMSVSLSLLKLEKICLSS